jgi:hypothetical protein
VTPSIGAVVHYTSYGTPGGEYGKECRAAIVTEVEDAHTVGLCVLNPTGLFLNQGVVFDDDDDPSQRKGGSWHFAEHVPGTRPPRH